MYRDELFIVIIVLYIVMKKRNDGILDLIFENDIKY